MSAADARYWVTRLHGLLQRTLSSLRARGWRATLQRIRVHTQRPPALAQTSLYQPEPADFAPFSVPSAEQPQASIVIPVYNHIERTLVCLRALAAHPPAVATEIIVVDDASDDATPQWLPQITGLRYLRRADNGGFIAACNDGAALARGDYLVLLNNDTVPQPGWLDALVNTFTQHRDAGLVGSQLLYPDGRLQESGGVVFSDGSGWSYGRFESADDPRYRALRTAHYCSGAALAIPRVLFETLGGLDRRYTPAYYEDTDLAFQVRAAGLKVLVQPASRVVHDEGTSNGTDPNSGIKDYQTRNQQVFARQWTTVLAHHPRPGEVPSPALLHRHQRQILILDEAVPQPNRDSGSLRQFNLIRMLLAEGAHVVFVPTRGAYEGEHTHALQALGVEVWYAPYLSALGQWLRAHGPRFDVVMLVRYHLASECLPLVRRYAPQAKAVFDTVDLHYLRERRGAQLAQDAKALHNAERTRQRELDVMTAADVTVLVSPAEQAQLRADAAHIHTELLSNLHEVAGTGLPWAQRKDVVFVGGFGHPPNIDAMQWFIGDVFPHLRRLLPDIRFHCIGANPTAQIRELARTRDGVEVHGFVPDVTPYMEGCRVAVAPLRFGAGVKGKINLSMAHGQPVVATTCAAEGMHLTDGRDVLVADDAAGFAAAIARLHEDQTLWERLSANGLDNITRHFSLDAARAAMHRIFLA